MLRCMQQAPAAIVIVHYIVGRETHYQINCVYLISRLIVC